MGSIPVLGRFQMPKGNEACVPRLLRHHPRAQEPQLLSLCARAPKQEKPLQWEAHAPQLEIAVMQQWRSSAAS